MKYDEAHENKLEKVRTLMSLMDDEELEKIKTLYLYTKDKRLSGFYWAACDEQESRMRSMMAGLWSRARATAG